MTVPVRLTDLRDRATRIATRYPSANMAVESDVVLALVDAVEAAHKTSVALSRCAICRGWTSSLKGGEINHVSSCPMRRFDFTADQPTTTKGET